MRRARKENYWKWFEIQRSGCKAWWERSRLIRHWVAVGLILHSGRVVRFADLEKPWRISSLYLHRSATNSVLDL